MSASEFYADPRAYDIAFGGRDFVNECNFLEYSLKEFGRVEGWSSWEAEPAPKFQTSSLETTPLSFLGLGASPARHARELARRGWRSVALDLSREMPDYAQAGAVAEGLKIETVCANMTDFTLQRPVMLAANLIDGLSHLTTNEHVIAHCRAVSRNLCPGGIFVIEMSHPKEIWHDSLPHVWTSTHEDGTEIDALFGSRDDPYDWITQQWTVTARLDIREPGKPPRVVESHSNHRWYQAQELRALVDLSQAVLQVLCFGSAAIPPAPLDSGPSSDSMIVVLRR